MFELFTNPFSAIIGGALVSSPIVIHLINRMRFRKVRWAAMEFLLKSQKRNRRRLIIEQIILLLLRILMVLLLAVLLARFLGFSWAGASEAQQTLHVILLDDTPSMGDFWREDGRQKDSFDEAKRLIVEKIATPAASQANTAQLVEVIRLSDVEHPRPFGRMNATTLDELRSYLNPLKPSPMRVSPMAGIAKAKAEFDGSPRVKHVLHVVGDFRAADWSAVEQEALSQAFNELKQANVTTFLLDSAHPEPSQGERTPRHNDNLSIIDLRPETRVAARYSPVEFSVYVANYSNSERKNVRVAVKLNGQERAEGSVNIASLPPNEVTQARFTLAMDRTGSAEAPLERFNLVSAHLENEQAGLLIDNARYTAVELRERVPLLLVEGKPSALRRVGTGEQQPTGRDAECFYLYKLFTEPIKGYDVHVRTAADLEKMNLQPYVGVFLCGVPRLGDAAIKNLEEYVAGGGGVTFFLGPDIKVADADFYNEKLYADGKGLFPAPIARQPANFDKKDEEIVPSKWSRRLSGQQQVFPRDKHHPALESLYTEGGRFKAESGSGYDRILQYVVIDRYFPVNRLTWKHDPESVVEIMTLPNLKPMANYSDRVIKITDRFPLEDEKYADYKEVLSEFRNDLRRLANTNQPLFELSKRLEEMLTYDGDKEKRRPSLRAFFQRPELAELARDLQVLLDEIKYGDPLYIAKQYGVGRVVACTTAAGSSWNDLEGLSLSHYPPLMMSLLRYLASASTDVNLVLGTPYEYRFRATQYSDRARKWRMTPQEPRAGAQPGSPAREFDPLGEQVMEKRTNSATKEQELRLPFSDGKEPGVYVFEFSEQRLSSDSKGEGPQYRSEYRALAYNIDARNEGDLRRASRDDLTRTTTARKIVNRREDDDAIAEFIVDKKPDLSESPWLYLTLLLVLIAEQAMAVRLSFHTRPAEGPVAVPVPTGRGVMTA